MPIFYLDLFKECLSKHGFLLIRGVPVGLVAISNKPDGGYPIFQKIISKEKRDSSSPLFVCSGKGVSATGRLTNDGFVIYKDSTASLERSKTAIERDSHKGLIKKLVDTGYMEKKTTLFYLVKIIYSIVQQQPQKLFWDIPQVVGKGGKQKRDRR